MTPTRAPLPDPNAGIEPTPDVVAARRAGDAGRRVLLGLIASQAPAEVLDGVAADLDAIAARLAPHAVRSRYDGTEGISVAKGGIGNSRVVEHHLLLGRANPLAPPLTTQRFDDGTVQARATYDLRYEGMPGWVHGGAIALAFDLVLGLASGWVAQRPAMTGTLTLKYRQPSKLWTELVYEARAESVGTRTIRAEGTLAGPDGVCVEAEGIWVKATTDIVPAVEPGLE
jgi:acyl-coenzyme A thioesterase PaaI-like protein